MMDGETAEELRELRTELMRELEQLGRRQDEERRTLERKVDREVRGIKRFLRRGAPELLRLLFHERGRGVAALTAGGTAGDTTAIILDQVDQVVLWPYVYVLLDVDATTGPVLFTSLHGAGAGDTANFNGVEASLESIRGLGNNAAFALLIRNHTGGARNIGYLVWRFEGLGGPL